MSYEKVKQATQLTIGMKQTLKAVEQGMVKEVFVAKDADPKVTGKIALLCKEKNIPVEIVDSMKQLGKACGIEVGAATAAILIHE
ncbi:50S ribosomal protein L7ae-like protein [Ammoniphilus sp. CFH 90114]|uniref:50S ribosomal protein L7ae-like protein n=1 Tax=Ammoniphilus sp. CFH 90114 TaxID=2493665 RepID=UPI00100F734C|nr:50S ribosomal protein L7ae-like protein [Ammoniphilus sp. CFH 90114]RXT09069.1 50S ribosomal protein L7ae-like protein [Ammoniphilus sp. CFH 90114]